VRKTKSKKYFLNFIEEAVMNSHYSDNYIGGRIEIWTDESQYSIEEIRFFTCKQKEFFKFREKWDFKEVDSEQLKEIKKFVKENFFEWIN
jgi:hypothetical protein